MKVNSQTLNGHSLSCPSSPRKVGYITIYRSGSSRIIQEIYSSCGGEIWILLFDSLRSLVARDSEEENLHVFLVGPGEKWEI